MRDAQKLLLKEFYAAAPTATIARAAGQLRGIFARAKDDRAELYIYDEIGSSFFGGGLTAQQIADQLREMKGAKALDIFINSPGGNVFDGVAIYNQIARFAGKKTVYVDGLAASIASVIAMAGDEIRIAENARMMIHDPWGLVIGTSADMRKVGSSRVDLQACKLEYSIVSPK